MVVVVLAVVVKVMKFGGKASGMDIGAQTVGGPQKC